MRLLHTRLVIAAMLFGSVSSYSYSYSYYYNYYYYYHYHYHHYQYHYHHQHVDDMDETVGTRRATFSYLFLQSKPLLSQAKFRVGTDCRQQQSKASRSSPSDMEISHHHQVMLLPRHPVMLLPMPVPLPLIPLLAWLGKTAWVGACASHRSHSILSGQWPPRATTTR